MAAQYGLKHRGGNYYTFRDPSVPHRTVMLREITVGMQRQEWKRRNLAMMYGAGSGCLLNPQPSRPVFQVWLAVKRKPKIQTIQGDLLDAMALAADILHRTPGPHRTPSGRSAARV